EIATRVDQTAEDVALGAEVERDHLVARFRVDATGTVDGRLGLERRGPPRTTLVERVGLLRCYLAHQIQALHAGGGARGCDQLVFATRADRAILRPLVAQVAGEGARVDAPDGDDTMAFEVRVETFATPIVRSDDRRIANDEPSY